MIWRRRVRETRPRRRPSAEDHQRTSSSSAEPVPRPGVPGPQERRSHLRPLLRRGGLAVVAALALLSAAVLVFWGWPKARSPGSEDAAFLAKSDAAMTRMMAAMQIQTSHEVDRDFVALMAPHHLGAIEMAQAELSYGHNTVLRHLAQEIIVTQQEEIAQMRFDLGSQPAAPSTGPEAAAFLAESRAAMTKMMIGMRITPFYNVDRDFVAMMIPHHQGAIDLAEAELRSGHNLPLLGLAQKIIATQAQQIAVMRRASGLPLPVSQPPASTSRPRLAFPWIPKSAPSARGGLPCDTAASLPCWPRHSWS